MFFCNFLEVNYQKKIATNPGKAKPEGRLHPATIGTVLLFWFVWLSHPRVHCNVSILDGAFFGSGGVLLYISLIKYVADACSLSSRTLETITPMPRRFSNCKASCSWVSVPNFNSGVENPCIYGYPGTLPRPGISTNPSYMSPASPRPRCRSASSASSTYEYPFPHMRPHKRKARPMNVASAIEKSDFRTHLDRMSSNLRGIIEIGRLIKGKKDSGDKSTTQMNNIRLHSNNGTLELSSRICYSGRLKNSGPTFATKHRHST